MILISIENALFLLPFFTLAGFPFPGLTLTTAAVTVMEGIGTEDIISTGIIFYPNPAKYIVHLQITLNQANHYKFEIFNSNGILVRRPLNKWMEAAEHDIAIDLTHLLRGICMAKLRTGNE
jgi:Secretion system C-terminal sorting domain